MLVHLSLIENTQMVPFICCIPPLDRAALFADPFFATAAKPVFHKYLITASAVIAEDRSAFYADIQSVFFRNWLMLIYVAGGAE